MLFIKNNIHSFLKRTRIQHKQPLPLPYKNFNTKTTLKMPLVVPGINSGEKENSKTEEWTQKLVGKKIGESSDSTVSFLDVPKNYQITYHIQTFAKTDLPKETRVIEPGMMVTKDFKPDR
jgi:hypothetical protein